MPVRRGEGGPARRQPGGRWDPFSEFENLWGEMGRLFQRAAPSAGERPWVPLVEEEETEDAYVVRAELPGVPRENVMVELDSNELRITGDLSEEQQGKVLSRRTGRFSYRTTVPSGIDEEGVAADLSDGVLMVRVPKTSTSRRRTIEIGGKG
ncbi:MAG TPA: Hsp20/alpha crystallin family protein [Streptomyces sp.]|nr:Hsp20/alpha crystallin family protein [Streptomyces sp.]